MQTAGTMYVFVFCDIRSQKLRSLNYVLAVYVKKKTRPFTRNALILKSIKTLVSKFDTTISQQLVTICSNFMFVSYKLIEKKKQSNMFTAVVGRAGSGRAGSGRFIPYIVQMVKEKHSIFQKQYIKKNNSFRGISLFLLILLLLKEALNCEIAPCRSHQSFISHIHSRSQCTWGLNCCSRVISHTSRLE